jgi:hypothetical protein
MTDLTPTDPCSLCARPVYNPVDPEIDPPTDPCPSVTTTMPSLSHIKKCIAHIANCLQHRHNLPKIAETLKDPGILRALGVSGWVFVRSFHDAENFGELLEAFSVNGITISMDELRAIANHRGLSMVPFPLPYAPDGVCMPLLTKGVRDLSAEDLSKRILDWLERSALLDAAATTEAHSALDTYLTSHEINGASLVDHGFFPFPVTVDSCVFDVLTKIRETRSWGPNPSVVPRTDRVSAALARYYDIRMRADTEGRAIASRAEAQLRACHRDGIYSSQRTAELNRKYASVRTNGYAKWADKMLQCVVDESCLDELRRDEPHPYFKISTDGSEPVGYVTLKIGPSSRLVPLMWSHSVNASLRDWVGESVCGVISEWTPDTVTSWFRRMVGNDVPFVFEPLLPGISGRELLELTPAQLGLRMAIDGFSPLTQLNIISDFMSKNRKRLQL